MFAVLSLRCLQLSGSFRFIVYMLGSQLTLLSTHSTATPETAEMFHYQAGIMCRASHRGQSNVCACSRRDYAVRKITARCIVRQVINNCNSHLSNLITYILPSFNLKPKMLSLLAEQKMLGLPMVVSHL